jgi:hypothetical protein
MRVLTVPLFNRRYHRVPLPRSELITLAMYDFAREEQIFALGDILRYLRKVYPVTQIYSTWAELVADGWFVMEMDPVSLRTRYVFQENIWRPTVCLRVCVWKQQELRQLDETHIRIPDVIPVTAATMILPPVSKAPSVPFNFCQSV